MHFSRMLLQLLRSRRRPTLGLWDSSRLTLRVLPTEIDIFGHVNNGMYFSIMDLGRLDMMVRSGVWKTLQAKGWSGVVSAETISFRKSLKLGHRYHVDTCLIGVDGRTAFFEHRIVVDDEIVARAFGGTRLTASTRATTRVGAPLPRRHVPHRSRRAHGLLRASDRRRRRDLRPRLCRHAADGEDRHDHARGHDRRLRSTAGGTGGARLADRMEPEQFAAQPPAAGAPRLDVRN